MSLCNNCPRGCNVDRTINLGYCGVSDKLKIARVGKHFGEEPCISGTMGSGTVFFSGCPLKCVYCQNYDISQEYFGEYIDNDRFIAIIKQLENTGVHNINFVTPTHYFKQIEDVLKIYKSKIPLVYNSSGYEKLENIKKDLFDVYLFDLKYFSREKSSKYSSCNDYFEVASEVIKKTVQMVGKPIFDENGILKRGVVVRHLILPSATQESIKIIDWLNRNASDIIFSLMSQYVPMYNADKYQEINRKITKREYNKVLDYCYDTIFSEIYVQDLSSATKEFIPTFDLTGI